jgi:peptide/nickel transport system ATP-binding protein
MSPPDGQTLIRVEGLSVDYRSERGEIHALSRISFALRKGEVVAVVGESGCGKSTLALSMIRLLPIPPARFVAGRVFIGETDVLAAHPREIQQVRGTGVAMIFQEPLSSLNPVLKIKDQIGEAIVVRKSRASGKHAERDVLSYRAGDVASEPRYRSLVGFRPLRRSFSKEVQEEMIEALSLVRIADPQRMLNRYPFELSGGMRQRVMIAMALAESPTLLIADEPTTALDVTTQAQVLQLMRSLVDSGKTSLLLITHDLGVSAQVADRVLVMYAGEVVEDA